MSGAPVNPAWCAKVVSYLRRTRRRMLSEEITDALGFPPGRHNAVAQLTALCSAGYLRSSKGGGEPVYEWGGKRYAAEAHPEPTWRAVDELGYPPAYRDVWGYAAQFERRGME